MPRLSQARTSAPVATRQDHQPAEQLLRRSLGSSARSPVRHQPLERQQAHPRVGPSVPPGQLGHGAIVRYAPYPEHWVGSAVVSGDASGANEPASRTWPAGTHSNGKARTVGQCQGQGRGRQCTSSSPSCSTKSAKSLRLRVANGSSRARQQAAIQVHLVSSPTVTNAIAREASELTVEGGGYSLAQDRRCDVGIEDDEAHATSDLREA